ncbi:helix-turn-helix domain-containing protein [Aquimarina addita]
MEKTTNYIEVKKFSEKAKDIIGKTFIHVSDEYQILFIKSGILSIRIGEKLYEASNKTILFFPPGQTSKIEYISKYFEGLSLVFDTDYFLLCLKNQVKLCFYPFFQLNSLPLLKLSSSQWMKLLGIVEKISFEVNNRESWNDDLLCRLYLNVLLIEIERLTKLRKDEQHSSLSRKRLITSRFKKLVEKNFMQVRKVADYADKLFISPTYLNDTVKGVTGQSASEIIQDRIILEIKAKLIQTEDTVSQIALKMEYQDTSYFCRFFKKNTGVSPQIYRETNHLQTI